MTLYQYLSTICDDSAGLFKVAVQEAVANAVTHGAFPVKITIFNSEGELGVLVEDHGSGFDIEKKIKDIRFKSTFELLEERKLSESGRGILMMYEICSEVSFNTKGTKVLLKMTKDYVTTCNP